MSFNDKISKYMNLFNEQDQPQDAAMPQAQTAIPDPVTPQPQEKKSRMLYHLKVMLI